MPINEYGQPTDSKGNVLTQSQVIEAELDKLIIEATKALTSYTDTDMFGHTANITDFDQILIDRPQLMKAVAALVLKHRHDVYFQAYRDGLQQGRKEAQAIEDSK